MTDQELREALHEIDESDDINVTSWEAEFIESVAFQSFNLSLKQRATIEKMIERYLT